MGPRTAPPAPHLSVYEINDCDWVVAYSAEAALLWYMTFTGCSRKESLGEGLEEPAEVPEENLDVLKVWDEDTDKTETFRQRLAAIRDSGEPVPAIFASREY